MSPRLRSEATLTELLSAIRGGPTLLGRPASLVVRSVAIQSSSDWFNHVTVATLVPSEGCPAGIQAIELDRVTLVEASLAIGKGFDLDTLRLLLTKWREVVGAPSGFSFQDTLQPRRFFSDAPTSKYPGWQCSLHELLPDKPSFSLPSGPFLAPDQDVFAPDVASLASYWLQSSDLADRHTIAHEYSLILEDRRGRIASFTAEDGTLTVNIDTMTDERLFCGLSATSYAGVQARFVREVSSNRAIFEFDSAVQELDLWLMLSDGYALDNYHESPWRASWGRERSIYNRPPELANPTLATLNAALTSGEGQRLEFKPFIRLRPRDPKSQEILKTSCGFANAQGGFLFLGVSDSAEPVGVDAGLRKSYAPACKNDLACLRDAYVRDLKLLLNEGLSPPLEVEFAWFDVALGSILRLEVSHSAGGVTHLIENGEIFRRVGATNHKLRPADVLASTSAKGLLPNTRSDKHARSRGRR